MTNLSSAVGSSLTIIRGINADIARLQEEAKSARKAAIEPFLDALAASGEVSLIIVRGSTPGFNDGEPCEHSADFFVNIKNAKEEDLLEGDDYELDFPEEFVDGLANEQTWNRETRSYDVDTTALASNEALCRAHGHVYAAPSAAIRKAISDVIFDTVEEENDTNYFVTYVLKDGKFEVATGEYDCGY